MRILKLRFILFVLTFSIIFFMGCPQSPQSPQGPLLNNYIHPLVGVWKLIEWSLTNHTDEKAIVFDELHVEGTIEFKEDQTHLNTHFKYKWSLGLGDPSSDEWHYIIIGIFTEGTSGTWSTSGNEITMTCLSCDPVISETFVYTVTESIATASLSGWEDDQYGVPKYWTWALKFRKQ